MRSSPVHEACDRLPLHREVRRLALGVRACSYRSEVGGPVGERRSFGPRPERRRQERRREHERSQTHRCRYWGSQWDLGREAGPPIHPPQANRTSQAGILNRSAAVVHPPCRCRRKSERQRRRDGEEPVEERRGHCVRVRRSEGDERAAQSELDEPEPCRRQR